VILKIQNREKIEGEKKNNARKHWWSGVLADSIILGIVKYRFFLWSKL
jgi:hypothetical protein